MTRKTEPFRRSKRPLDGVLLFDKPLELSSNTALLKVRGMYRAEKAGHTGTLDPLATGLLPICLGEATKFTHALLDADKRYSATIRLGQRTTTGDAEGEVIEERPVALDEAIIREVLLRFTGEIAQLPPMHSALKHQGKPLYEYIRKGEVIDREARQVTILELHLERWTDTEMDIDVLCSKGTYIRTLAEDIGEALGCGGHLIALRRTGIGGFGLDEAHTLPELEALDEAGRDALLLPVDSLLREYPVLEVDPVQAGRLAQGQRLGLRDGHPDGKRRLYSEGEFIGLGELVTGRLSPSRLLSGIAQAVSMPKSA